MFCHFVCLFAFCFVCLFVFFWASCRLYQASLLLRPFAFSFLFRFFSVGTNVNFISRFKVSLPPLLRNFFLSCSPSPLLYFLPFPCLALASSSSRFLLWRFSFFLFWLIIFFFFSLNYLPLPPRFLSSSVFCCFGSFLLYLPQLSFLLISSLKAPPLTQGNSGRFCSP